MLKNFQLQIFNVQIQCAKNETIYFCYAHTKSTKVMVLFLFHNWRIILRNLMMSIYSTKWQTWNRDSGMEKHWQLKHKPRQQRHSMLNLPVYFKGNTQFLFCATSQKSGALQVCITFLQLNQKNTDWGHNSLTGTDHWNSKLSTNIQCEKNNLPVCSIFQKIFKKINKKTYF